jgi:hypothetical protein
MMKHMLHKQINSIATVFERMTRNLAEQARNNVQGTRQYLQASNVAFQTLLTVAEFRLKRERRLQRGKAEAN